MSNPLVSIIIPVYNRGAFIGATLDSILAQSYVHWECLVIDDGSTDATASIVKGYEAMDARIRYYLRPDGYKHGGNGARNYGYHLSTGVFVQWFDSDDLMYPNYLSEQVRCVEDGKALFSLCLYDLYDDKHEILKTGKPIVVKDNFYLDYVSGALPANLQSILFRRAVLEEGMFNEGLLKFQDYEFLQRFLRNYQDCGVLLNSPLLKVIRHPNSITEAHSPVKIASALEALLTANAELPKDIPLYVRQALTLHYLKILYLSFTHRMDKVFYTYLFKVFYFTFFKGILIIGYTGMLYGILKVIPLGAWHYKYIYNFYRS